MVASTSATRVASLVGMLNCRRAAPAMAAASASGVAVARPRFWIASVDAMISCGLNPARPSSTIRPAISEAV